MAAKSPNMKVGDEAGICSRAMNVFLRYKLDLCCGGGQPLDFVAQNHELHLGKVPESLLLRGLETGKPQVGH